MNILIIGMGYVGVTTALVFAELGWKVTGLDMDARKMQSLSEGMLSFYEPGLDLLLRKHLQTTNIQFTTDAEKAIRDNSIIFLCVGTPSEQNGSADLQAVRTVSERIGSTMTEYKLIVVKSTVPINTNQKVTQWIKATQTDHFPFDVVSNPEFLREGSALHDSLHPDRIIIGSESEHATQVMKRLYDQMNARIFITKPKTAEMIKYASNAFLATKISYINELSRLCEKIDVNVSEVAEGMGMDHRIGPHFLHAGIGYGGSCFPKDSKALLYTANENHSELSILEKVTQVNETQPSHFMRVWEQQIGGFAYKTIAILGIAFKPDTDDLREAPSISILHQLMEKHASVRMHDPVAKLPTSMLSDRVSQFDTVAETLQQCDAVILCSEWDAYISADWAALRHVMKTGYVFDGRNMLNSAKLTALGYQYYGIGNR